MPSTPTLAAWLLHAWQLLQARWQAERLASLHELDAHALADMGVHPSELSSIDAEWRGQSDTTRRRIAAGVMGGRHA